MSLKEFLLNSGFMADISSMKDVINTRSSMVMSKSLLYEVGPLRAFLQTFQHYYKNQLKKDTTEFRAGLPCIQFPYPTADKPGAIVGAYLEVESMDDHLIIFDSIPTDED